MFVWLSRPCRDLLRLPGVYILDYKHTCAGACLGWKASKLNPDHCRMATVFAVYVNLSKEVFIEPCVSKPHILCGKSIYIFMYFNVRDSAKERLFQRFSLILVNRMFDVN